MQDLLLYVTKGLCEALCQCRAEGKKTPSEPDRLVTENLFLTVTNVCFDADYLRERIAITMKSAMRFWRMFRSVCFSLRP